MADRESPGVGEVEDGGDARGLQPRDVAAVGRSIGRELIRKGAFLPALLRVEDVARLLDVVPRVVRRMIAEGTVPATKLGRAYVVPRDAFIRAIEDRARAAQPPASRERFGAWS